MHIGRQCSLLKNFHLSLLLMCSTSFFYLHFSTPPFHLLSSSSLLLFIHFSPSFLLLSTPLSPPLFIFLLIHSSPSSSTLCFSPSLFQLFHLLNPLQLSSFLPPFNSQLLLPTPLGLSTSFLYPSFCPFSSPLFFSRLVRLRVMHILNFFIVYCHVCFTKLRRHISGHLRAPQKRQKRKSSDSHLLLVGLLLSTKLAKPTCMHCNTKRVLFVRR